MADLTLTEYQYLVLEGVSKALTNQEIVTEIGQGGNIPNEIRRIIQKLKLRNRMHLMLHGINELTEADSSESAEAWLLVANALEPEEQMQLALVHHVCVTTFALDLGDLLAGLHTRKLDLEKLPDSPRRTVMLAALQRLGQDGITLLAALRGMANKLNLATQDITIMILCLVRCYQLAAMFDLACALQEHQQAKEP